MNAPLIGGPSRAPRQGRSRASYERMLVAAESLMADRGTDDFTLSDVSRTGKVSIGSIYCRFDSKDDLVRAVQHIALERIDEEQIAVIEAAAAKAGHIDELVRLVVDGIAESLKQHAPLMRALMARASSDALVAETGKRSYAIISGRICAGLLAYREEIRHPDPDRAVGSSFRVIYAAMARYLGFGSAAIAAGEGDWRQLKIDLADMMSAFLMTKPRR